MMKQTDKIVSTVTNMRILTTAPSRGFDNSKGIDHNDYNNNNN